MHDFLSDRDLAFDRLNRLAEVSPGWNIRRSLYFMHYAPNQDVLGLLRTRLPGVDGAPDGELQFIEAEVLAHSDYAAILRVGYPEFMSLVLDRLHGSSRRRQDSARRTQLDLHRAEIAAAATVGQAYLYGAHLMFPASHLSLLRTFGQFVRDVYQVPKTIRALSDRLAEGAVAQAIADTKVTGIPRVMIGAPRVCGEFFSDQLVSEIFWPALRYCAETLIGHGITPIFHLDGCWDRNIELFTTLPPGKMIVELDGATDLAAAARALAGHTCLLGDVPATLFTLGTPEDVTRYCHRIAAAFPSGGWIFGSGCTLPYEARPDNVAAFFDASRDLATAQDRRSP